MTLGTPWGIAYKNGHSNENDWPVLYTMPPSLDFMRTQEGTGPDTSFFGSNVSAFCPLRHFSLCSACHCQALRRHTTTHHHSSSCVSQFDYHIAPLANARNRPVESSMLVDFYALNTCRLNCTWYVLNIYHGYERRVRHGISKTLGCWVRY